MQDLLNSPARREPSWLVITVLLTIALAGATYYVLSGRPAPTEMVKVREAVRSVSPPPANATPLMEKFTDEASMRTWLQQADKVGQTLSAAADGSLPAAELSVGGLGEPDRLMLAGTRLFYATESKAATRQRPAAAGQIRLVKAWPVEELNLASSIDREGSLLVTGETLVVVGRNGLDAYDVKDEKEPQTLWHYGLGDGQSIQAVQAIKDEVYVVTGAGIRRSSPCPLAPLTNDAKNVSVPCDQIWHLGKPAAADLVASITVLDSKTGAAKRSAAFIGSHEDLAVTLASGSVYVTLVQPADDLVLVGNFLKANADLVPSAIPTRLDQLRGYNLTAAARETELEAALTDWSSALSENERLAAQAELARRLNGYWETQRHEAEQSVIMRLDGSNLEVLATGSVPGRLQDRRSLAGNGDYLELAVNVGERNALINRFGNGNSVPQTDLYVLDGILKTVGSLLNVGQGATVFETRFVGTFAYAMTGRETDPPTAIDLSDPSHPIGRGTLKISGHLSFLHPISATRLLTVSKEGSSFKISLYDVSGAAAPKELSRYSLDEYWTDVQGTHQGFFIDQQHQAFFMPGGRGGYLMSYEGDQLAIITPVTGVRVVRAAAVNDLLYLAGEDKLTAVSTSTWKRVMEVNWARP